MMEICPPSSGYDIVDIVFDRPVVQVVVPGKNDPHLPVFLKQGIYFRCIPQTISLMETLRKQGVMHAYKEMAYSGIPFNTRELLM